MLKYKQGKTTPKSKSIYIFPFIVYLKEVSESAWLFSVFKFKWIILILTTFRGWLLVADGLVWVFQNSEILPHNHLQGLQRIVWQRGQNPVSIGSLCRNVSLMSEDGQTALKSSNLKSHLLEATYAEEHLWSHNTLNLEADGLQ